MKVARCDDPSFTFGWLNLQESYDCGCLVNQRTAEEARQRSKSASPFQIIAVALLVVFVGVGFAILALRKFKGDDASHANESKHSSQFGSSSVQLHNNTARKRN